MAAIKVGSPSVLLGVAKCDEEATPAAESSAAKAEAHPNSSDGFEVTRMPFGVVLPPKLPRVPVFPVGPEPGPHGPFGVVLPPIFPKTPVFPQPPHGPFGVIVPEPPPTTNPPGDNPLEELVEAVVDIAQGIGEVEQGDWQDGLSDLANGIQELGDAVNGGDGPPSYPLQPDQIGAATYFGGGWGNQPIGGTFLRAPPPSLNLNLELPPGVTATATSQAVDGAIVIKVSTQGDGNGPNQPQRVNVPLPPGGAPGFGTNVIVEDAQGNVLKSEQLQYLFAE